MRLYNLLKWVYILLNEILFSTKVSIYSTKWDYIFYYNEFIVFFVLLAGLAILAIRVEMKCYYVVTRENIVLEYNMQVTCNGMWCIIVEMYSMIVDYVLSILDYNFTIIDYNITIVYILLNEIIFSTKMSL